MLSLPRNIVQFIVDETHDLFDNISSLVIPSIISNLENIPLNENILTAIEKGLEILKELFKNMETDYQKLKKMKFSGYYIEAKDYVVGSCFDEKLIQSHVTKEMCDIKAKFIPIRTVLQQFLSLPAVLETILHYMDSLQKEKGVFSNFIQGEIWQNKMQLYYKDKIVIPLFLFFL